MFPIWFGIAFKNLLIGCKYLFLKSISTVTWLLLLQQTYFINYQPLKSKSYRVDRVISPCVYYVNMWSQRWNIFLLCEIVYIIYYMMRLTWTKLFKIYKHNFMFKKSSIEYNIKSVVFPPKSPVMFCFNFIHTNNVKLYTSCYISN